METSGRKSGKDVLERDVRILILVLLYINYAVRFLVVLRLDDGPISGIFIAIRLLLGIAIRFTFQ